MTTGMSEQPALKTCPACNGTGNGPQGACDTCGGWGALVE